MIKVTVAQTAVRVIKGVSEKTPGKPRPYEFRVQPAYAHTVDEQGNASPYPDKCEIGLDDNQQPYAVGDYQLHPSSVYIDRNGRWAVQPRLTPLVKRPAAT